MNKTKKNKIINDPIYGFISLEKGIGLAYIQTDALASNEPIVIQIRNKEVPITVTSPPFV